jgi:hypothetical protein
VHQLGGAHDFAAEGRADRLMSQADAQDRNLARKMPDQVNADSGLSGVTVRARGEFAVDA